MKVNIAQSVEVTDNGEYVTVILPGCVYEIISSAFNEKVHQSTVEDVVSDLYGKKMNQFNWYDWVSCVNQEFLDHYYTDSNLEFRGHYEGDIPVIDGTGMDGWVYDTKMVVMKRWFIETVSAHVAEKRGMTLESLAVTLSSLIPKNRIKIKIGPAPSWGDGGPEMYLSYLPTDTEFYSAFTYFSSSVGPYSQHPALEFYGSGLVDYILDGRLDIVLR